MTRQLTTGLAPLLAFSLLLCQAAPAAPADPHAARAGDESAPADAAFRLADVAAATEAPRLPPISVRVLPGTDPSILDQLEHVRRVKGPGPATLQLDLAHKHILNAAGEVVVEDAGPNPMYLQSTVDKWRYIASLTALARAHPQAMHVVFAHEPHPQDLVYSGEVVDFVVNLAPQRQLVVFNISPIGTIQLLYARYQPANPPTDTVDIPANASEPFGADHVIAVSAEDPERMRNLIGWLAETAQALGIVDTQGTILEQIASLKGVRVGVIYTHTCLSPARCPR